MMRREFLESLTATAALPLAAGAATAAPLLPSSTLINATTPERPQETVRGEMRYRPLGRTGEEGGAQEAVLAARKAGKVRFIGFTGHKDPLVHLRMLEVAAKHGFRFDSVQMPLNVMDTHFRSFEKQVLPGLVKEGIGVLGMKSMGDSLILKSKVVTAVECLHYAMTLPTSTVITGIDSQKILEQDLEAVKSFQPLTERQVADLLARTAKSAAAGRFEGFKTTNGFDGTAQNPHWLGKADEGPG